MFDRAYCHNCNKETEWRGKNGVLRCTGCKDRFPCTSKSCGHEDCEEARKK